MPERIPQSSTARIPIYAVLATDGITPATGKTIAITISKNGAGFGNPSGGATNATEIGSGWYYFAPSSTDTGTLGPLLVLGTSATINNTTVAYNVVDATNGGLSNLDAAVTTRMATYTQPTGFLAATFPTTVASTTNITAITGNITGNLSGSVGSVTGAVGSVTGNVGGNVTGSVGSVVGAVGSVTGNVGGNVTGSVGSVVGLTAANLDVAVSTRLAAGSYTAPDNGGIAAIQAQTDLLTFSGAGVDANIASVNTVPVTGTGAPGDTWGPA